MPVATVAQRALEAFDHFLAWWLEELAELFPMSWRRRWRPPPPRNVITIARDRLGIGRLRSWGFVPKFEVKAPSSGDEAQSLPRAFRRKLRRGSRVSIRVSAPLVLRRQLDLPLATESHLAQALSLQLDRHIPLKPELVYVDHRVVSRHPKEARLIVELAAVHRDRIDLILSMLRSAGHEVTSVDVLTDEFPRADTFNFIRAEAEKRQTLVRRANAALCALLILIALAGQGLLAPKRAVEIAALREQIAALSPQIERARHLSRETARLVDEQRLTASGRLALEPLKLLEELSARLPDGAWLTALEIMRTSGEVRLSGFADDATALLPLIEAAPGLTDARLRGPVVKDQRGRERYDIAAHLVGNKTP